MTAALTSKKNCQVEGLQKGRTGRKARTTNERLEKALLLSSAADIELKALFRGANDEFGLMHIIYPNF
jgi:hypothetical protein